MGGRGIRALVVEPLKRDYFRGFPRVLVMNHSLFCNLYFFFIDLTNFLSLIDRALDNIFGHEGRILINYLSLRFQVLHCDLKFD